MTTAKSIVSNILVGLRLDNNNYNTWHRKINIFFLKATLLISLPKTYLRGEWLLLKHNSTLAKSKRIRVHNISCYHACLTTLFISLRTLSLRRPCGTRCSRCTRSCRQQECAMQIKVGKLKCQSTKGVNKHLLALNVLFANLEKAEHLYSDEQEATHKKQPTVITCFLKASIGTTCIFQEYMTSLPTRNL